MAVCTRLSGSKLPDEAGNRILGTGLKAFICILGTGLKAFVLQAHYDNPNDDPRQGGLFRIYYTSTLCANDAGVLKIGDLRVLLSRSSVYLLD